MNFENRINFYENSLYFNTNEFFTEENYNFELEKIDNYISNNYPEYSFIENENLQNRLIYQKI